MSDAIGKHIAKAFDSLADLPKRELEATADLIGNRRHPLHNFASVFREVGSSRELGSDPHLARFHVRQFVTSAADDDLDRLQAAEAPFWGHVRDAVLAARQR